MADFTVKAKKARHKHSKLSPFIKDSNSLSLWQLFSKQIGSLIGLFLLALVVAAAYALLGWQAVDPSWNFANGQKILNPLGAGGAIYADLSMQFFGLAGGFLLIPLFIWSIFLLLQKLDFSLKRAVSAFPFFLSCFSLSLALLPEASHMLPQGLGGQLGQQLQQYLAIVLPLDHLSLRFGGAFFFALLGFVFLFIACGALFPLTMSERLIDNRDLVPLGFWEGWLGFFHHLRLKLQLFAKRMLALIYYGLKNLLAKIFSLFFARKNAPADLLPELVNLDEQELAPLSAQDRPGAAGAAGASSFAGRLGPDGAPYNSSCPAQGYGHNGPSPFSAFDLPSVKLLNPARSQLKALSERERAQESAKLLHVLRDFGINGQINASYSGPVVTLYEFEPAPGIKSSRIMALADDIARSMYAVSARVAILPGRNALGIELPNKKRETVYLGELLDQQALGARHGALPLALGKTIGGDPLWADLAKMPHLLVAGTTGSGKSVAINTMIMSLVYHFSPEECRFIMIDPKMLELSIYEGIPHLLTPVVTDPKKAIIALKWAVREMEQRYQKMAQLGVRNIIGFNEKVKKAIDQGESLMHKIKTGFDSHSGEELYEMHNLALNPLPYIVVIIDEMADLMLIAGKEIEALVQRLAQMARAAGIHLIMATQRPSVDVITGTIKANFPTRISFAVTSKIDSRTILGEQGAEQLLGQGDMLFMQGGARCQRLHGPFISSFEVQKVVNHLKQQARAQYVSEVLNEARQDDCSFLQNIYSNNNYGADNKANGTYDEDPYAKAVAIMLQDKKISTSYIQRRLNIGYNRAASIIERMEQEGLISPANHVGKREILININKEEQ